MKITAVEALTCDGGFATRNWLFVKVTTDEGIVGWGEGYDWQAAPSLALAVESVGREIRGEDPRRIEWLNQQMWSAGRCGVPERMKVIAAIDIALWDIKAKWLGVPVYELLGGLYRDRIPLYWSHFASNRALFSADMGTPPAETLDAWVALADDVVKAGYKALKTNLLIPGNPPRLPASRDGAIERSSIRAAAEFIGRLRERLGPDFGIMLDVGQEYRMGGIIQLAKALEPFDLYWLEAEGFDPAALLAARSQTRTRLCHGESLIRREQFRPFFERHVTDVVMVETLSNGLTETRRIAELAAHYDVMISPHNYMSPFSNLVNAHLCAAMPNVEILEIDPDDIPWKQELITHPLDIREGMLHVPDRPGFGADPIEDVIRAHPLRTTQGNAWADLHGD